MNHLQPRFETLKCSFYNAYKDSEKATTSISMQALCGTLLPSWHKRKEQFNVDFNQWLDRLDIRQASVLIDILKKDDKPVPKWMKDKQYAIDYNQHGCLDLIRIEK